MGFTALPQDLIHEQWTVPGGDDARRGIMRLLFGRPLWGQGGGQIGGLRDWKVKIRRLI